MKLHLHHPLLIHVTALERLKSCVIFFYHLDLIFHKVHAISLVDKTQKNVVVKTVEDLLIQDYKLLPNHPLLVHVVALVRNKSYTIFFHQLRSYFTNYQQ